MYIRNDQTHSFPDRRKGKMKCGCRNNKWGCNALDAICNLGNFSFTITLYKIRTSKILNSILWTKFFCAACRLK